MVQLRVELSDTGVRVSFAVEHADTAQLVEATWPQLTAAFEQRGLTVDQVLVDLLGDNRWAEGAAFGEPTADQHRGSAPRHRRTDRAEPRNDLAPASSPSSAVFVRISRISDRLSGFCVLNRSASKMNFNSMRKISEGLRSGKERALHSTSTAFPKSGLKRPQSRAPA
jgi:hypothetical protein